MEARRTKRTFCPVYGLHARASVSRLTGSYVRYVHHRPTKEVVGGILVAPGIEGFLAHIDEFAARADTETIAWRRFVDASWQPHDPPGADPPARAHLARRRSARSAAGSVSDFFDRVDYADA